MLAITGIVMGFLFLLLMVVPVALLIMGGVSFYDLTQRKAALLIIAGGVLIGLGALDAPFTLLFFSALTAGKVADIMMFKNLIITAIHYIGYLCLGLGVFFLSQHFKQQQTEEDTTSDDR